MKSLQLVKIFFLILIAIFPNKNSIADGWSDFIDFFDNGGQVNGSCLFGDPSKPNSAQVPYKYYPFLPAWNRDHAVGGRDNCGNPSQDCLRQYSLNDYGLFSDHTCAQDNPSNTPSDPNSRPPNPTVYIRNVTCWFGGCFITTRKLDGIIGECKFVPTKDVIVAKRMCARIASPEGDGNPADDGYTTTTYTDSKGSQQTIGQHLDNYGVTQLDELVSSDPSADGTITSYPILTPKVCIYEDPWALDVWPIFYGKLPDLFDLDPMHQPFHSNSGQISPIAEIIIFVLKNTVNSREKSVDLVGMIVTGIGAAMNQNLGDGISLIFKTISQVMEIAANIIIDAMNKIGQINRVVMHTNTGDNSGNYGCVKIPLGPYPPNYCSISMPVPNPGVFSICTTDGLGNVVDNKYMLNSQLLSTQVRCVRSNTDNNLLYNSVRSAYSNVIPNCTSQRENCFTFSSAQLSGLSGGALREALIKLNNLIPASDVDVHSPIIPLVNSQKTYRAVYITQNYVQGLGLAAVQSQDQYSYSDLLDCADLQKGIKPGFSSGVCQTFYGIDVGDFSDQFIIDYRQSSLSQENAAQSQTNSLQYAMPSGAGQKTDIITKYFYAKIDPVSSLNNITVYKKSDSSSSDSSMGSVARADFPVYADYNSSYTSGLNVLPCASSSNFAPCMNVQIKAVGQNGKQYLVSSDIAAPKFVKTSANQSSQLTTYLAGHRFSAYATDASNILPPFSAPSPAAHTTTAPFQASNQLFSDGKAVANAQNSILGSYKNNQILDLTNCDWDTCAIYLSGFEMLNGNYVRGGSWLCLNNDSGYDASFFVDPNQAVLVNNDTNGSPSVLIKDLQSPTYLSLLSNNSSVPILPLPYDTYFHYMDYAPYNQASSAPALPSSQGVRGKIGAERINRCVEIPLPLPCKDYSDEKSNTVWCKDEPCAVGVLAQGACKPGYVAKDSSPIQGYCVMRYAGGRYTSEVDTSDISGCVPGGSLSISSYTVNGKANSIYDLNLKDSSSGGSFSLQQNLALLGVNNVIEITFDLGRQVNMQITNQSAFGESFFSFYFINLSANGQQIIPYNNIFNVNNLIVGANKIKIIVPPEFGYSIRLNFSYN